MLDTVLAAHGFTPTIPDRAWHSDKGGLFFEPQLGWKFYPVSKVTSRKFPTLWRALSFITSWGV